MLGLKGRKSKADKVEKTDKTEKFEKGRIYWQDSRCEEPEKFARLTRPGQKGRQHVVTGLSAAFSAGHSGLLTFQRGPNPPLKFYCHTQRDIPCKWVSDEGEEIAITLSFNSPTIPDKCVASVVWWGYTEDVIE